MNLREITNQAEWDEMVGACTLNHPLQLWAWGELKQENGWRPVRLATGDRAVAQLLFWRIPKLGKYIAYVPRGPLSSDADDIEQLAEFAKAQGALYLRLEPATKDFPAKGFRRARDTILMAKTYTIDLAKSEEDLLSAMARTTRYNVGKVERSGVSVVRDTTGQYLEDFWRIYTHTAQRAGFGLHSQEYYQRLYQQFGERGALFIALLESRPVAFVWLVASDNVAFELYGGMDETGSKARANYLLKWKAIQAMKEAGCSIYDFNGRLNEGVSSFKSGFGPDETDFAGTLDRPFSKLGYMAWTALWPIAKPIGRKLLGRVSQ